MISLQSRPFGSSFWKTPRIENWLAICMQCSIIFRVCAKILFYLEVVVFSDKWSTFLAKTWSFPSTFFSKARCSSKETGFRGRICMSPGFFSNAFWSVYGSLSGCEGSSSVTRCPCKDTDRQQSRCPSIRTAFDYKVVLNYWLRLHGWSNVRTAADASRNNTFADEDRTRIDSISP